MGIPFKKVTAEPDGLCFHFEADGKGEPTHVARQLPNGDGLVRSQAPTLSMALFPFELPALLP